jgi:ElaB/YqjD/DUF883 family membrane-anchored ribosome-binding protein
MDTKHSATDAGDSLSNKVESVRSSTETFIEKAADQAQFVANQAIDSVSGATKQVRATMSDVADGLAAYTQDNPVQAILISAAVGALLASAVTALIRSRD